MPKKNKIIENNNKKRELNDKEENLNIINSKKIKINNKIIKEETNINSNNNKNEKTLKPISISDNDFKIVKKENILEEKKISNDIKSIDKIEMENEETIIVYEPNNGNNENDVNNKENKNVNVNETLIVEAEENDDNNNNKIDNEDKNEKEINKEIIIEKVKIEINNNNDNNNKNTSIEIKHYNKKNNKEDIDNSKNKKKSNNNNDSYNKDSANDKEDKLKEDDIKHNKKQQTNKIKQNVSPVRKSKRLMEKKMEVVTIDVPDISIPKKKVKIIPEIGTKNKTRAKSDSPVQKSIHNTGRRKRMNADQDLITHQNIDDTENLGKKNPLEIIKKVIGNSDEDVELIVGAQLPVLINPEINRMKYQLGEIVIIKDKNENLKEVDQSENEDNVENESEEEKGNKKKKRRIKKPKSKKGKVLSDNETVVNSNSNTIVENSSTNENEKINTNSNINTIPNTNDINNNNNISNEINNTKTNNNYTNNNNNNNGGEKLYYIHFINQDKRLDSWRREEDLWTKKKYPEISNDSSETTTRTTPYLFIPDDKTKLTRSMKRKYGIISESLQSLSEIDPKLAALEKEREEITKVKNIEKVQFGNYLLNSWYFSPYPNEYKNEDILYICDHCMKYMKYESTLIRHRAECPMIHPPGTLVYEKDNLRVYEIDGKKEKLYCQNFCLLSKLFLDHKTVYYDIEPFLFYVLTEKKIENGKEIDYVMGYFSKEKRSFDDYNLACILVLPPYQRKGYGHFLIEFSYELSKRENKIGSPEKPLSDLGLVGYRTYWQSVLLRIIKNNPKMNFTLRELSLLTSIRHEDIVSTLGSMNMLKYWKGEHSLCVTPKMVEEFLAEHQNIKLEPMIDASLIHDTFISESVATKKKTNDITN